MADDHREPSFSPDDGDGDWEDAPWIAARPWSICPGVMTSESCPTRYSPEIPFGGVTVAGVAEAGPGAWSGSLGSPSAKNPSLDSPTNQKLYCCLLFAWS